MDAQLKKMLKNSISWKSLISRDGAGEATYGDSVNILGFIEGEIIDIKTKNGEIITSSYKIVFDGSCGVKKQDILVLDGCDWPILRYKPYYDEKGILDILEVYL